MLTMPQFFNKGTLAPEDDGEGPGGEPGSSGTGAADFA
jgi:hypothetical protein